MNEGVNLTGVFDLHIHAAPDLHPRCVDDLDAVRQASAAGMAGILLKSHYTMTADRARIAEKVVCGTKVFGSLALNDAVGGLNPAAVEVALRSGAREIFMPTISAANSRTQRERGISILDAAVKNALREILALIKQYDVILGTGHLSREEIHVLVSMALDQGLQRIVITHPEHPLIALSVEEQQGLGRKGIFFERCFACTFPRFGGIGLERMAADILRVSISSTLISTDLGIEGYPKPVEGMKSFIAGLQEHGIGDGQIETMARRNPAFLLGIEG
jgi:hypothetical protein